MATVFRGPVVVRPPAKRSDHALRSQAGVGRNLALTASQDAQFRAAGQWQTYDWPIPQGKAFPRDLRSFVKGTDGKYFVAATKPPQAQLFPNPFVKPRTVTPRLWRRPTAILAVSPMIPMAFPLPVLRPRRIAPLAWRPASDGDGVPYVPFPFGTVLALPPQPTPAGRFLRGFQQALDPKYLGIDTLPKRQGDWPVPTGRGALRDLRTAFDTLGLTLLSQDTFFGGAGKPLQAPLPLNPVLPRTLLPTLQTWAPSPLLPLLNAGSETPFKNFDYPNPRGKSYPVGLRTHVAYVVTNTDAPFAQRDWSLPVPRPVMRDLRMFVDDLRQLLASVDALPFRAADWPLPRPKATWVDLRAYEWPPQFQLVGLDALPHRQRDWPMPRGKSYPNDLRTWVQIVDAAFVERAPNRQAHWPLPTGRAYPPALRTWLHGRDFLLIDLMSGGVGRPVTNDDWPLPQGKPFPVDLRTYVRGLVGPGLELIFLPVWATHSNKFIGRQGEGSPLL